MGDILFLADTVPSPLGSGARVRGYQLLKHLSQGRRVHLVAFADDREDMKRKGALASLCASRNTLWRSVPNWRLRLAAGLGGTSAALVSAEDAQMRGLIKAALIARRVDVIVAQSLRLARLVPERLRQRVVVDLMEPPSSRAEAFATAGKLVGRMQWHREARLLRDEEAAVVARASLALVAHENHAAGHFGQGNQVRVAENGVDAAYYDPACVSRQFESTGPLIGLVGQDDHRADRAAAIWFMEAVMPHIRAARPEVRVVPLGSNASGALADLARRYPDLRVAQGDQRPWLKSAAVVVVPWTHAGGSSLPLLEAMAMARPLVASATAAAIIDHGGTVQVAGMVGEFADRTLGLITPGVPAGDIGRSARARVLSLYSWDRCLPALELLLGPSKQRAADRQPGRTRV